MFVRTQLLLWGAAAGLTLLGLAWADVDGEQAQRMHLLAASLVGAAVFVFLVWPAPAVVEPTTTLRDLLREKAVCPHCLQPNPLRRVRCRRCIAPIGWQATMDAYWHELSGGWALGALARSRMPNGVLLTAAWLWFPSAILGYVGMWILSLLPTGAWGTWNTTAQLAAYFPFFATAVFGIWNVTRNYVRTRRDLRALGGGATNP